LGGRGSGRPASLGLTADLCHRTHSIDLDWLRRKRLLTVGRWSTLTWSVRGEKTGSVQITAVQDGVLLSYRARQRGEDWQQIEEAIPLVQTATNFGPRREWFRCLSCGRRCRIIYGGVRFRCRKCQGLRYESQYEPAFARAASRALKIRDKLGGKGGLDEPFPEKPKGMRWRTYWRLVALDERLRRAWATGAWADFGLSDWEAE
jgi:hypothetical protein